MKPLRKYLIVAIVVLTTILLVEYLLTKGDSPSRAPGSKTPAQTEVSEAKPSSAEVAEKKPAPDTKNFAVCEQYLRDLRDMRHDWFLENRSDWNDFITEGYSIDEITLATDHFGNSNFAAASRVELLRLHTEPSKIIQQANEAMAQDFPELVASGFRLVPAIPVPALENFKEMTAAEKARVIEAEDIRVDDVAYFILQDEVSDEAILKMLSALDEPSSVVTYDGLEAISLLDYAVEASRVEVFKELLNRGLQPTTDSYLGSTMEWALNALVQCCEKRDAAVEIALTLQTMGAKARFDVKNDSQVHGSFPRKSYRFDESDIRSFRQEYGLDLTLTESRQALEVDTDNSLVQELEAKRQAYVQTHMELSTLPKEIESCESTVNSVNAQWQPQQALEILNEMKALYPDSPDIIKSELAAIDPVLVDKYLSSQVTRGRMEFMDVPREIWDQVANGEIDEVINYFSKQQLSDGNKRFLVWQILGYDLSYYEALSQSQLMVEPIQYSDLRLRDLSKASVQKLEKAGADLYSADKRDKSLLFYAVGKNDLELLKYMEKQGYPYSFDELGQDPLFLALRRSSSVALISVLMRYNPEINDFHRSRMAVIQLKYPDLYDEITGRYPELQVRPDTELPRVR
ncbi:hypothetical protein ACR0ST_09870 [Aliidiomarina sp. Khilg15.8]